MRCIITGGAGFIGSNLAESILLDPANEVMVVDDLSTGKLENLPPNCRILNMDIRTTWEREEIESFGADVVFHLAAKARIQPSFRQPDEFISVNCMGTVRMLEFARRAKCRVVYAGSSSFYFDPHANPYAHSKWIGEEHCRMYSHVYGVPVAIARFFNVYGKRHIRSGSNANVLGIFEQQTIDGKPLTVTGTGDQRRDFTHVDDICRGLVSMSSKPWYGEVFNLGRGRNYSINEVAAMFGPSEIDRLPARSGEAIETLADTTTTRERLGWEPLKNLPDYVDEFLKSLGK